MATIESFHCDIPFGQLKDIEEFTFQALQMDRETVMEDFDDVYENTLEKCLSTLKCKGMCSAFSIGKIDESEVSLGKEGTLESPYLAKMLSFADEVVLYAATVHGFEELVNNPDNEVFDNMFYNAWGVGLSMSCHRWLKQFIADRARESNRYVGRSWSPGEGELELSLLEPLFNLLDTSRIGLRLTEAKTMSPIMSICGFMGVSNNPAIQDVGLDELSCH